MIVTTYTCDKCGHAQTGEEQTWEIGVSLKHIGFKDSPFIARALKPEALWCRECVEGIGLLCPPDVKPANASKPDRLEDIVLELIHEALEANA